MTNFTLRDGIVVDVGQMYEMDLYFMGTFPIIIEHLYPRTEQMWYTIQDSVWDRDGDGNVAYKEITWSTFCREYNRGTIRRYDVGGPKRSVSPHPFT